MRLAAVAAAVLLAGEVQLVERSVYLMGTRATVRLWAENRAEGLTLVDSAIRELELTEQQLSTWIPDTPLAALNRQPVNTPWQADGSLCALLDGVAVWQRRTGGTFDPAIGAMLDAWDVHGEGRVPSAGELQAALDASGFRHLDVDPHRCTVVRRRNVRIDSGAFGKGEALDRAARALGQRSWMIDLGGQVSVRGTTPNGAGWPVAIANPEQRNRTALEITLQSGSLSTSGGSERDHNVAGRRIGHIVDPRTGVPAAFPGSVSVWHESGFVADVLSTALFVMGPDAGIQWAEERGFAACYLQLDAAGRVTSTMTAAFRLLLNN
jgi:thiamine biosynthesis lipoprotein